MRKILIMVDDDVANSDILTALRYNKIIAKMTFVDESNIANLEGDCIPISFDNGKTWCVEYDFIKKHPERNRKSWLDLIFSTLE